jgi:hypothetical protein
LCTTAHSFHIILDPAGDAKQSGRQLATCSERSVTLQLCETLKETLLNRTPHCTVTITRTAGETRTQEQRAQIANQLSADLFIHISCFEDTALRPQLMLYHTLITQTPTLPSHYQLIPTHKAADCAAKKTNAIVQKLYTALAKTLPYTVHKPYAIPDARLQGIMIPACTIEFGISRTMPWTMLIEPLSTALAAILENADAT